MKNLPTLISCMTICYLFCASVVLAASDNLINLPQGQTPIYPGHARLAPGTVVILPNGRSATIRQALPDGQLETDLGVILSPEGIIVEGEDKGKSVTLEPEVLVQDQPDERGNSQIEPEQPGQNAPATPEKPLSPDNQAHQAEQPKVITPSVVAPEAAKAPPQASQPDQLTLAELLPMTTIPGKTTQQPAPEKAVPEKIEPKKEAQEPKQQTVKPQEKKAQPKAEKKTPPAREEPKAPETRSPQKSKPGQELRIPPDAAKNGDLSFLEGCWQGTRPEYYSKRTIKECFCFGANGKSGKRRVFDPLGHRQCIGASRATLSASGVLSVTSSGAACNDGERWGQAEMICKNSGPKTPCSWVFRDANNGSQSYQIPFVRVESCGR